MLIGLVAIALADTAPPPRARAPSPADSVVRARVVRQFEPVVVQGGRASDPGSIETAYTIPARALRTLPVDRLIDAVALQAGVVATGEDLHVRGGRAGELAVTTLGVPLLDPQSGQPMELPLFAVRSADLLAGGLDAEHQGALAGELDVQTEVPTARPAGLVRWTTDTDGGYDAGLARVSGPLGRGFGLALAAEARLDDQSLPVARTETRHDVLGASLGWRADNHLLGWAKLAPVERPQRGSIEAFASRVVRAPYDPMFTFDGWVTPNGALNTPFPYDVSAEPIDSTSISYRAADHTLVTDERRIAVLASRSIESASHPARVTVGFLHGTALTSVGSRHDSQYIDDANRLLWGVPGSATTDPFHAYLGDTPFFSDRAYTRWFARADAFGTPATNQRLDVGVGVSYDDVRLREIDDVVPQAVGIDSLRRYHAYAPGGFAYGQHRGQFGGLIWNTGLRLQAFSAGPDARTRWALSPRLGFAYPISDRDAFSVAYARIHQDPERDLLYESRSRGFNRHPLGNADLEPAEMITYQAAVKHILDPEWSVQLGLFDRDVYSQPGMRNAPAPNGAFRPRYESVDDGHAGGVELAVRLATASGQRVELAYTFLNAWGTQSSADGYPFGLEIGERTVPIGAHALDWNERHVVALTAALGGDTWQLTAGSRIGSGRPWTPSAPASTTPPRLAADQSLVNSRRLSWSEDTDVAIRWSPKLLFGARALVDVANVFDHRTEPIATLGGYPNPSINTRVDEYGAYRTDADLGGGAYYDDVRGAWIAVHDPRLGSRPRSIRLGVEIGR